ncbi:MAG: hypothetical protein GY757_09910 [bacterium]|nr:hypothetical protein [bacterium]
MQVEQSEKEKVRITVGAKDRSLFSRVTDSLRACGRSIRGDILFHLHTATGVPLESAGEIKDMSIYASKELHREIMRTKPERSNVSAHYKNVLEKGLDMNHRELIPLIEKKAGLFLETVHHGPPGPPLEYYAWPGENGTVHAWKNEQGGCVLVCGDSWQYREAFKPLMKFTGETPLSELLKLKNPEK